MTEEEIKKQEEDFIKIANKVMMEARRKELTIRIVGGVAVRIHCPKFKHLEYSLKRSLVDIDFAAYRKDVKKVEQLFANLGYQENQSVKFLFGTERRIFFHPEENHHCDVFLDRLRFCHDIPLEKRLEIDYPTISLVDLLLSKLQIVQINEKDIIDVVILLREHDIGSSDKETINTEYLSILSANDWGLWKTVIVNLEKIKVLTPRYLKCQTDEVDVKSKIDRLLEKMHTEPKSIKWKIRNLIGEKMKWYREVEEVMR